MKIDTILTTISKELSSMGAKAIVVGGSVRDYFLNFPIKDYDVEVYGLSNVDELLSILGKYGKVKLVGKSFGVLKFIHDDKEYDFSFPREEKKVGAGHRGFEIYTNGLMSFSKASKRRDFTINAMGFDIEKGEFLDPYCGLNDLKRKILRHIDDKTFIEDPLRVYRGVQFCARFGFTMDEDSKKLCKELVKKGKLNELAKERIFDELKKILLLSDKPSFGFELFDELGVLETFPLHNKDYLKLDKLAKYKNLKLLLASLVINLEQNQVEKFLYFFTNELKLIDKVKALAYLYTIYSKRGLSDFNIRKFSSKVDFKELSILCEDDFILNRARELGVDKQAFSPLLRGKDLIDLGFKPGRLFSVILKDIYQLQLEGKIKTYKEAIDHVKSKRWD